MQGDNAGGLRLCTKPQSPEWPLLVSSATTRPRLGTWHLVPVFLLSTLQSVQVKSWRRNGDWLSEAETEGILKGRMLWESILADEPVGVAEIRVG